MVSDDGGNKPRNPRVSLPSPCSSHDAYLFVAGKKNSAWTDGSPPWYRWGELEESSIHELSRSHPFDCDYQICGDMGMKRDDSEIS